MRQRVGSIDVARRAGVSRATVSYVLNGRADVSIPDATRDRVLEAARELGYRPNRIAASLAWGRTSTFGIVVPRLDNSFMAGIVYGIQEQCALRGFRTLIVNSLNDRAVEDAQVMNLLEHQVDGVVCVPSAPFPGEGDRWVRVIREENVPCVVVDVRSPEAGFDCVVSANREGSREAVAHLIRLGHRRIAYLQGHVHHTPAIERRAGYEAALTQAGIALAPELVAGVSWRRDDAAAAAERLLSLDPLPTALFAANDALAGVAMKTARERGLLIPEQLSLVGFGDLELADFIGLTTVRQSPQAMGARAAERLFDRLEEPELPAEVLVEPTELIVRETCGPPDRRRPDP